MATDSDPIDIKTLLRGGLNVAMMSAFSYHQEGVRFGIGAKIGAVIAVAEGLVTAFYPRQQVVEADPTATAKDVGDALTAMSQEVIGEKWWTQLQVDRAKIVACISGFHNVWGEVADADTIQVTPDGRLEHVGGDEERDGFIRSKYNYFNPFKSDSLLQQFRDTRFRLETSSLSDQHLNADEISDRKRMTIGLYGLIGSVTLAYLNACVAWAWARELQMGWEYQSYRREQAGWIKKGRPAESPTVDEIYAEVNDASGFQPLDWNDFVETPGSHVHLLLSEAKALLDYFSAMPGMLDSETMDLCTTTTENWKAIASSAQFEVYNVQKSGKYLGGEYLVDIAKAKYGDAKFADSLFKANSDTLDYYTVYPEVDLTPPPPPPALDPFDGSVLPPPPPRHGKGKLQGPPRLWKRPPNPSANDLPKFGWVPEGTRLKIFVLDALQYNLKPLDGVYVAMVPSAMHAGHEWSDDFSGQGGFGPG